LTAIPSAGKQQDQDLFVGGEALDMQLPGIFIIKYMEIRDIKEYGPQKLLLECMIYNLTRREQYSYLLASRFDNTRIYILNEE